MKKLNLILFVALATLFTSCEKESSEGALPEAENALLGSWSLTAYKVEDGIKISESQGEKLESTYTSVGEDFDQTVEFKNDPKVAVSAGSFKLIHTETFGGQSYSQNLQGPTLFKSIEWKMDSNTIVFTDDSDEESIYQIMEMTDNKLTLSTNFNVTGGLGNLVKITTSGNLTITLEKSME